MSWLRRFLRRECDHDFIVDEYFWLEDEEDVLVCLSSCDCGAWRMERVEE